MTVGTARETDLKRLYGDDFRRRATAAAGALRDLLPKLEEAQRLLQRPTLVEMAAGLEQVQDADDDGLLADATRALQDLVVLTEYIRTHGVTCAECNTTYVDGRQGLEADVPHFGHLVFCDQDCLDQWRSGTLDDLLHGRLPDYLLISTREANVI